MEHMATRGIPRLAGQAPAILQKNIRSMAPQCMIPVSVMQCMPPALGISTPLAPGKTSNMAIKNNASVSRICPSASSRMVLAVAIIDCGELKDLDRYLIEACMEARQNSCRYSRATVKRLKAKCTQRAKSIHLFIAIEPSSVHYIIKSSPPYQVVCLSRLPLLLICTVFLHFLNRVPFPLGKASCFHGRLTGRLRKETFVSIRTNSYVGKVLSK